MESEFPSDPRHAELHSEGEGGEHHQHNSVLKKVNDKAKKIKDKIKKHGHGHSHEHEEEDDNDDDDEIVNDPQVHGAPMYVSAVVRSVTLLQETNINVEKSSIMQDDEHEQDNGTEGISRPVAPSRTLQTYGKLPSLALRNIRNKNAPNVTRPKIKFGPHVGLEGHPCCRCNTSAEIPHTNDQSNVDDPTGNGSKEANVDVDPLVSEFGNLNVHNVLDKKPEPESHDQFTPSESPTPESNPVDTPDTEKPDTSPKTHDTAAAGGPTMKEYLAEKLRPGDEDKALSEMITDAFTKKEEEGTVEVRPGSRVRMSEEVAARLGPTENKREGEDALAAGAESSGQGVVDRLRDAVGAWLGKSQGMQTAQDSVAGAHVSDATTAGGAERES